MVYDMLPTNRLQLQGAVGLVLSTATCTALRAALMVVAPAPRTIDVASWEAEAS